MAAVPITDTTCWPRVNEVNVARRLVRLRFSWCFISGSSDRHPHDLVERLERAVAHGDGQLGGDRGLGRGAGVVVDVVQVAGGGLHGEPVGLVDRKSTRLNSSHECAS